MAATDAADRKTQLGGVIGAPLPTQMEHYMYDIIPDIHGQADKLTSALRRLGYSDRIGAWRHSDPNRTCVFLGDFIDRGPNNAEVIRIVRSMIDAGSAEAIMGNHELNAIHYHTLDPVTGEPLREHSDKNKGQHQGFLREFPVGRRATADVVAWMRTLPIFLEEDGFRAVHASWNEQVIKELRLLAPDGILKDEDLVRASNKGDPLYGLLETTTKGPEVGMPDGCSFLDKDGHERRHVRVQWWKSGVRTWADIAISVPEPAVLPTTDMSSDVLANVYPADAKPVFFGHYWLDGAPTLQAPNALCLDYSAGTTGPLVTYLLEAGQNLSLDRLVVHDL